MYVCMYVYMYVCMFVNMYVCSYIIMYVCVYVYNGVDFSYSLSPSLSCTASLLKLVYSSPSTPHQHPHTTTVLKLYTRYVKTLKPIHL